MGDAATGRFGRLLLGLNRCEYGRLEGDHCPGCGRPSTGNPPLLSGTVIGHTRYGNKITVPSWRGCDDPQKWVERA